MFGSHASACRRFFFFVLTMSAETYPLSLHDALPIWIRSPSPAVWRCAVWRHWRLRGGVRSEEHTSELQSQFHLVCRLLLEQKKHSIAQLLLFAPPDFMPLTPERAHCVLLRHPRSCRS